MARKITAEKHTPYNPIHSAKEKKQNRAVIVGFVITGIIIISLIGYAVLYETVLKNRISVAKVNGVDIDNDYFQDRVRLERNSYIQQFNYLYAQYQLYAEDPDSTQFFQSQLAQVQQTLDNFDTFSKAVLDRIIDEEIINQKAADMGLSVSDHEVETAIRGIFGFYPEGTPTPGPTNAPVLTPTPSKTQLELLKYTPTAMVLETDISDEIAGGAADNTESESESIDKEIQPTFDAELGEPTLSPTQTFEATPTIYTEDLYQEQYQSYIDDLSGINVNEQNLRKYMHNYLLGQKVREEVIKDIPREQEQVWVRHILVQTQPEALIALNRLNQGEDWAVVVADVSIDTSNKDNGGDLGWFPRGRMVPSFEDVAFKLKPGEISDPVESDYGWHVIQMIGKATLPLSDDEFAGAQEIEYENWLQNLRDSADIKINDVWKEVAPKDPTIPDEFRVS